MYTSMSHSRECRNDFIHAFIRVPETIFVVLVVIPITRMRSPRGWNKWYKIQGVPLKIYGSYLTRNVVAHFDF